MKLFGDAGIGKSLGAAYRLGGTGENDSDDLTQYIIFDSGCIKLSLVQILPELAVVDPVGNPG